MQTYVACYRQEYSQYFVLLHSHCSNCMTKTLTFQNCMKYIAGSIFSIPCITLTVKKMHTTVIMFILRNSVGRNKT
jgi:hypothetical protein